MSVGGFIIDCIVIIEKSDLKITPVKNPAQVSAYDYSEKVLIGSEIEKNFPLLTPKFERAKLYETGEDQYSMLISGTAAIQAEESLAKEDAGKQAEITFDNIRRLIDYGLEHLKRYGMKVEKTTFNYLRVYIKRNEDFSAVKAICESNIMEIAPVYLIADICRAELLVEIEGVTTISIA